MKIVYIHHAQRDSAKGQNQDNPLTEYGIKEASIIGEMFKEVSVKTIYMGEHLRHKLTTNLINTYIQAPVITDNRLNEWVSKIEDRKDFANRTHNFLKEIILKHSNDDMVFCVTSGVNINEFVTFFNQCNPIKGFAIMQAVGVCPVIFHYNKD